MSIVSNPLDRSITVMATVYYERVAMQAISEELDRQIRDAVVKEIVSSPQVGAEMRELVASRIMALLEKKK